MRLPYIIAVVALSQMGATDCGQVIKDPGFDLWCGDSLCAWKTERGTIARVPTWHQGDSGVQLQGLDTAIEQFTSFNSSDATCVTFDLVANVDANAEVYLNVDVEGDGTLEMHERLPTSSWQPLSYSISFKPPFDGVRFELTMKGTGTAVLANLGVTTTDGTNCVGLTPLDPGLRKNGSACGVNTDCESNLCTGGGFGVCAGCVPHTDNPQSTCGAGEVCGIVAPVSPVLAIPAACIAAHSGELGELCFVNDDCASSLCNATGFNRGYCSSCASSTTCGTGACRTTWVDAAGVFLGPSTCSAGKHGDACAADGDCTSNHCNGAVRAQCADGRACATRDDCPVAMDLTPGECTTVGIQGGSCE